MKPAATTAPGTASKRVAAQDIQRRRRSSAGAVDEEALAALVAPTRQPNAAANHSTPPSIAKIAKRPDGPSLGERDHGARPAMRARPARKCTRSARAAVSS